MAYNDNAEKMNL